VALTYLETEVVVAIGEYSCKMLGVYGVMQKGAVSGAEEKFYSCSISFWL